MLNYFSLKQWQPGSTLLLFLDFIGLKIFQKKQLNSWQKSKLRQNNVYFCPKGFFRIPNSPPGKLVMQTDFSDSPSHLFCTSTPR